MKPFPDIALYTATLVRLVAEHRAAKPDDYESVSSWEDLHDICDANEFLIEADRIFDIDTDASHAAYLEFANKAVEYAESVLFTIGRDSVVGVDCGRVHVAYEAGRVTAMWVEDPIDIDCVVVHGDPGCDVSDDDGAFWAAVRDYLGMRAGRPVIEWRPS